VILAIDPGNIESGYVLLNSDLCVMDLGEVENEKLLEKIKRHFIFIYTAALFLLNRI